MERGPFGGTAVVIVEGRGGGTGGAEEEDFVSVIVSGVVAVSDVMVGIVIVSDGVGIGSRVDWFLSGVGPSMSLASLVFC